MALTTSMHLVAQEASYTDEFPPLAPSPSAKTKIQLTRKEDGLLYRSEESHQEAATSLEKYYKNSYLPMVRKHYPIRTSA